MSGQGAESGVPFHNSNHLGNPKVTAPTWVPLMRTWALVDMPRHWFGPRWSEPTWCLLPVADGCVTCATDDLGSSPVTGPDSCSCVSSEEATKA